MVSAVATQALTFAVNLSTSYLLSRITAQDGPRLDNKKASSGDYGVPQPRLFGGMVRVTGAVIVQAEIKERTHKVEDYSEIVGAIGGAAQGFLIGGPVGAVIGAVAGGLLGFGAPDQKYYTYDDTLSILFADRRDQDPIEGLVTLIAGGKKIFEANPANVTAELLDADGKLIWRKYKKNKYLKSVTIYGGHTDQDVDPILEAEADDEIGHVYRAHAVLERLQLGPFGNSVPSADGIIQVKTGETVADFAEFVCAAANVDPDRDISSTALADLTLNGLALTQEVNGWDAIKPLMPVFAVDCAEVSGQIRFYKRSQTMRAVIPADHMGAHQFGDSPPEKFIFRREGDLSLPQQTSLTFIDSDRDFQPNTVSSAPNVNGSAASNIAVTIPLVMTAGEAASAVELMQWDAWLGRIPLRFALTDAWISLATGYAYGIEFGGQVVPYRITRKLRGANGIIECEALSDESVTYTASAPGSSGTMPDDESTEFADTRLVIIDGPTISDDHDDYGFYIVQGATEPGWTRGRIEVSPDGADPFVTIIDQPYSAVIGDVTGTLAAGSTTGLDDTLDTSTVLTVVLEHDLMELESATDDQLDNWANFAYVGKDGLGEYLQFKTATKVGTATWELTDLRRGRRGTDWAIGTHTSGEVFAILGGEGVFRIVYTDTSEWGNEFTFRGVTLHQEETDAAEQAFTNTGEGKRPFSPVNVEGSWDGSNNLTVTADLRSRLFAGGLGIDDNDETDWEFFGSPTHAETVSGSTVTFSAAEQTAAGLTPGDTVTGRVRQTSDVNDGRWRNFTIIGPNALTFDSSLTFDETSYTWDAG